MIRSIAVLCVVLPVAASAAQQPAAAPPLGTLLRVTTAEVASSATFIPSRQAVGTYSAFRDDTLFLKPALATARPEWYPVRSIARLEESTGSYHPYRVFGGLGAIAGAGVGILAVFAYDKTQPDACTFVEVIPGVTMRRCHRPDFGSTHRIAAALGGAAIGGTIGLYSARHATRQHWRLLDVKLLAGVH